MINKLKMPNTENQEPVSLSGTVFSYKFFGGRNTTMKNYGSKKKKRRAEYLERETRRKMKQEGLKNHYSVMKDKNSTIEAMAAIMGISLK